jgi:hypothetical protein
METMMSLINTEVKPFTATAYHNGQFIEVTEANFKGKWSVFSSIQLTSLSFAQLNLVTLQTTTLNSKN